MEIVVHVSDSNYQKLKEKLLTDDIVNRASIIFKEAKQFGKESGYICIIMGTEDRLKRALELAKTVQSDVKEITDKEKKEILRKIKEEEEKAIEGFGNILG